MRRAAKIDANHASIVQALRKVGATVQSLASVGSGCPDLLVGHRGMNYLLEVKDGAKVPSKRALNEAEQRWHDTWRGDVLVVESVDEALGLLARTTVRPRGENP